MKKNMVTKHLLSFAIIATAVTVPFVAGAAWDTGISNAGSAGTPSGTIYGIINTTLNWLLAILGFLGIIGFVISGILYLISAGDEDMAGRAKTAMINSIIGIIVALLGFVIIRAVNSWLGSSGAGNDAQF